MRGHRPRFPVSSLTLALGVILLSASALAGATGAPAAPVLQGPSSVSTSQLFQVSFYYPKGQVNRYRIEFYHCQTGSNVRPADSKTDPLQVGGCEFIRAAAAPISPDTGKKTVDVKYGMTAIYRYQHQAATNAQVMKWYQGNWYVRARLISLSGAVGPWAKWHRTFVGSPYVGKPIGIGAAGANNRGLPPAVLMRGLKPPRITAPMEGRVFYGGPQFIAAAVALPVRGQYAKWACCEIQWQRAVIVTGQNKAYAKTHTSGSEQAAFASRRSAWNTSLGLAGYSPQIENGPTLHGGWTYSLLSPHSHKFGYRYWFRLRERYLSANKIYHGPWSAWRGFTVQERFGSTTVNLGGVQAAPMHRLRRPARQTIIR